jgi:hypothetical protein
MHLVRRLEGRHGAARPGICQQEGLEHFVRSVGDENLSWAHVVQGSNVLTQIGRRSVGIAVPLDAAHLGGQRILEAVGRRERRLVGVQTNVHVDLSGVVSVESTKIGTNRDHDGRAYRWSCRRNRDGFCLLSDVPGTVTTVARSTESTTTELATIADNIGQYRSRVAALAELHIGTDRDDFVSAIHEAERQLRMAERGLARAIKTAG